jgi:hypothetical protein
VPIVFRSIPAEKILGCKLVVINTVGPSFFSTISNNSLIFLTYLLVNEFPFLLKNKKKIPELSFYFKKHSSLRSSLVIFKSLIILSTGNLDSAM